ncbi:ATP-dependent DNA helicase [Alkalisalibacterium limincola]|uniref:ATP-dependent DNA helicase n=1 Tax=Alkalisalibacterium limincola TaxID=2699169 RepID=A0A5C8KSQ3_9GAMM|nr:ATP-dependent DNA helicase [Alkalisalibacterium limincola]TXK62638.1 ATP-dependent DNA helicase [Alkalisalibacterium limincola]
MDELAELTSRAIGAGGALESAVPGFRPREAQHVLAEAVAGCIQDGACLVAEAGTGTGKTYAYLVPALLSGRRTIISTGTRALQDQLFHRDLPRVRKALGVGLTSALLKGRSNYLCLYRLDQARGSARGPDAAATLQKLQEWASHTRSGDLAEMTALAEDSPLWPQVTSTIDNCLGSDCPMWGECFVVRARQAAQAADLVVVNHHLLLADLALREEGFGEVLPGAETFVLDEAHQVPELAAQFFGARLSARQLGELGRDALAECKGVDGALAVLQGPVAGLDHAVRVLREAMSPLPQRAAAARALLLPGVREGLDRVGEALADVAAALAPMGEAAPGLEACRQRALVLQQRLAEWLGEEADEIPVADDECFDPPSEDSDAIGGGLAADIDVRWFELGSRGFVLQRTPLDVSAPLRRYRERSGAAWVFTSATLAVAGSFRHVSARLGLDDPRELLQPSPFDWDHQALCYLPPHMPEPNAPAYGDAFVEAVRPVLEASRGRAFLLFTSHRALREAADRLEGGPWPLFVQGSAPRHALLEAFRQSGNGVLLGAASFWEGVDVAGDALSVVVIDRLPFASPGDPVLEARLDAVRQRGGNPFRDEQVPTAVIALKQGVGRLIRTLEDRGVLVLCDPRLLAKGYGRMFLDSLPPMPRTRGIDTVRRFFDPVSFSQEDKGWEE